MCAGQCESCEVVIETGRAPCCGRVALGTIVWESAGCMIRISRSVEIIDMAVIAQRGESLVLVIDVTTRTGGGDVGAGKREHCRVMAEC